MVGMVAVRTDSEEKPFELLVKKTLLFSCGRIGSLYLLWLVWLPLELLVKKRKPCCFLVNGRVPCTLSDGPLEITCEENPVVFW